VIGELISETEGLRNIFPRAQKPAVASELREIEMPKGFKSFRESGYPSDVEFTKFTKERLNGQFCIDWGVCVWGNYKMRERIIIPIRENGKTVCWIARAIKDGQKPKEISPPVSIANKSHFIYGLDEITDGDKVVVVEGIFDCEHLKFHGYKSVSILGSHISDIQIGKLLAKEPSEIYLLFDGDDAGRRGSRDAWVRLSARCSNMFWKIISINIPDEKDPDDLSPKELRGFLKH